MLSAEHQAWEVSFSVLSDRPFETEGQVSLPLLLAMSRATSSGQSVVRRSSTVSLIIAELWPTSGCPLGR